VRRRTEIKIIRGKRKTGARERRVKYIPSLVLCDGGTQQDVTDTRGGGQRAHPIFKKEFRENYREGPGEKATIRKGTVE